MTHPLLSSSAGKSIYRLSILNPVNDPCTNLSCAIVSTTLNLNFRCADIGIERSIYCLANQGTLLVQAEVLQQHGCRKNLSYRVSQVLASCLWP